jgi:two-component system, chemotaxis family, response regulator Rcp1
MRMILIEDNPADVRLIEEALKFSGMAVDIAHFPDGLSAVAKLRSREEPWQPPPDIVFLDLNMPRLSGFDVLETLRGTPECAAIPIVIFTSSQSPADVEKAASLKVDRFVRKPTELREFFTVVSSTVRDLAG